MMKSNLKIYYITLALLTVIWSTIVFFDAPRIPYQTAAVADFNNSLVAYYSFDDGTAADNSGNGNGGTLSGGSAVTGKVNGAVSFAGGGSVAVSKSLYTSYPVTLCAWVKPDLKGNGLSFKIIGNSGFDLVMQESDGQEKFIVYNNVKEVLTPYSSRYSAGSWHHVCGMVDSGAQASIYVDGALAAGPANLGTANNFWNINIGNNFPGIVDEVRVYNTTLTAGQVSDVYSYTGSPNSVTPPNPDPNPNPNPNPDPNPPSIPVVNGLCSPTVNMCTTGTFSDVTDTDTEQKWSCTGSGGGTTASCSIPKLAVVPDPEPVIPNQPISNELIPSDRLYDWTNNVGVMGGIPTGRSVCASVKSAPYNAVGDGVADDTQAIVDAIRACAGKSQAVYFPAGTYKFTSKVIDQGTGRRSTNLTYSNITFRGAGMGRTILKPYMTDVLYVGNGDWPPPVPTVNITGGATRGSSTLTVDNAGSITEGKLITITQTNPNWVHSNDRFYGGGPVDDGHDQNRLMAITVLVKSKSGNTITIDHPLPIDMPNSPMITLWQGIVKGTGFEDMTIDMTNSTGQSGILFNQVYGCWVKGVEIKKPENRFLWFTTVSNCEVRDSYFHDARVTKKEGVDFYQNDTFNLIENNVLVRAGGPMIILGDFGGGVSMNVVAYNYLEDQEGWSDVVPYALSDNHGAHNMFNLFEGNVAQNISSDGYYGGASHETLFRNRFTSVYGQAPNRNYDYLWQYAIHLGHWAVNYNVVGNVLGSPGYASVYQPSSLNYPGGTKAIYRLGFPDCCNSGYSGTGSNPTNSLTFDTNVEATLVRHGNFDYFSNSVKWSPNISVRSMPASLYLRGQPSWWNTWGGTAFPPIGPDVSGYAQPIPAKLRYQAILSNSDIAPPEPSIPPAPNVCTSFTYSAWGTCSNNVQSRTVLTSSPAGCTGGVPVTTQACTSIVPVNALCSNTVNRCLAGTFSDTADTATNSIWSCLGSGGGTSLSCSLPKRAEANLLIERPAAPDIVVQKPIVTPQVTPVTDVPAPPFISRLIPSLGSSKKVSPYTVTSNKTPGEFVPVPDVTEEEDVITRSEFSLKETVKTIFSYIATRIKNGFYKVIGRDITLVIPLSIQTAAVTDFNSNLVAHYTFDDGTGADASGHSNAGTLAGGASIVGTGKSGQGLDPGSAGRMTLANDAVGTGDASICMWYYARSLPINGQLLSNGKLGITISTNSRFTFSNNGTMQAYTTSGLVTLNTWQHICVTRDSSGVTNFYTDGIQGGSVNQNAGAPVAGDGSLAIGNHSWASHVWDGYVDDVRIYNKVLSASEVQDVYSVLGGSVPASPPAAPAGSNNTPVNPPANSPPSNSNTPAQNVAPASVTAASCNASDVQAAIDAVKDEGIVVVPAGTCSWTTPVSVGTYSFATRKNTSKSVVIKGAGIDQTIILNNLATKSNALTLNIQEGKQVRVTGFTFDGTNTVDNYAEIAAYGSPGNPSFRIDHNTFRNITERGINVGSAYGLIDHNTFIRKVDASSPTLISISGDIKERNPLNVNDSWARPQDMGTSHAVYIEDNTLIHNINANGPYDAYEGARYVFRNNDVYGNNLGHHGYDSSYRGIVNFEIYNNHFTNSSPSGILYKHGIVFEIRSGSGVFFNNIITKPANATNDVGGYDSFAVLRNYRSDPWYTQNIGGGPCDGTNVNDGNSPDLVDVNGDGILQSAQGDQSSGYPCKDQIGRTSGIGPDGRQILSPVYGWNNNFNGKIGGNLVVGEHIQSQPNTRTATFHVKEGRDYFNGVPRPGYTPYTYPHPMTVSGFTSDAGGPVASVPTGNAAPQVVINIPPAPIVPNVPPVVPLPRVELPPVAETPQPPAVPVNPLLPQTTFTIKSILPTGTKSTSIPNPGISKTTKTNMAPGSFVPLPESEETIEIQRIETSFITQVKTIFSYIAARIVNGFYRVIGK